MKKLTLLGVLGLLCLALNAQRNIKPLSIGDKIPDIRFSQVLNYKKPQASLSDFKSSLFIIDFWSIWCASCIQKFYHLDSLKKKYAGNLDFLLVHTVRDIATDLEKVNRFLHTYKKEKNPGFSLPTVVGDTVIEKMFPHTMLPHYVWVNKNREVIAITDAEALVEKNIDAFFSGRELSVPLKEDILNYNAQQPLFDNNNGAPSASFNIRSTIAGYLKGLPEGPVRIVKNEKTQKHTYLNVPLLKIYKDAFNFFPFRDNRYIIESRKIDMLIDKKPQGYDTKNLLTYELIAPLDTEAKKIAAKTVHDINNFFGLAASIEKQSMQCWAIVIKDSGRIPVTKGAASKIDLSNEHTGVKLFINVSLADLVIKLNAQQVGKPLVPIVLDGTNYTKKFDLALKVNNLHDMAALRSELLKNGFDLLPVLRELEMLVIRDAE